MVSIEVRFQNGRMKSTRKKMLPIILILLILNLQADVKGILVLGPSDVFAVKGSTVTISCYTNVSQPVLWEFRRIGGTIEWKNVYMGNPSRVADEFSSRYSMSVDRAGFQFNLTIINLQYEDAGTYRCSDERGSGLHRYRYGEKAPNFAITSELVVTDSDLDCDGHSFPTTKYGTGEVFSIECNLTYVGCIAPVLQWAVVEKDDNEEKLLFRPQADIQSVTNGTFATLVSNVDISVWHKTDKKVYVRCELIQSHGATAGLMKEKIASGNPTWLSVTMDKNNEVFRQKINEAGSDTDKTILIIFLVLLFVVLILLVVLYIFRMKLLGRMQKFGKDPHHREESIMIESVTPLKSSSMSANHMISRKSKIEESDPLSVDRNNLETLKSAEADTLASEDDNLRELEMKSVTQPAEMKEAETCKAKRDDADENNAKIVVADIEPNQAMIEKSSLNNAEFINRLTKGYTNMKVINNKSRIEGVAIVNDNIYVLSNTKLTNSELTEYSLINLKRQRDINIPRLRNPEGLAGCSHNKALYISDDENVRKVNLADNSVNTWRLMYEPQGLSVTSAHNVLVTVWYRGGEGGSRVMEYTSEGQLIRVSNLSQSMPWAKQTLELSTDQFIICHGSSSSAHRVCVINSEGEILKSFGGESGRGEGQLTLPLSITMDKKREVLFVADTGNDRVVMLDYNLTYLGFIPSRAHVSPSRIYFDSSSDQLFVGGINSESLLIISPHP